MTTNEMIQDSKVQVENFIEEAMRNGFFDKHGANRVLQNLALAVREELISWRAFELSEDETIKRVHKLVIELIRAQRLYINLFGEV